MLVLIIKVIIIIQRMITIKIVKMIHINVEKIIFFFFFFVFFFVEFYLKMFISLQFDFLVIECFKCVLSIYILFELDDIKKYFNINIHNDNH